MSKKLISHFFCISCSKFKYQLLPKVLINGLQLFLSLFLFTRHLHWKTRKSLLIGILKTKKSDWLRLIVEALCIRFIIIIISGISSFTQACLWRTIRTKYVIISSLSILLLEKMIYHVYLVTFSNVMLRTNITYNIFKSNQWINWGSMLIWSLYSELITTYKVMFFYRSNWLSLASMVLPIYK